MPQAQHRRDKDWAEKIQDVTMVKLFESWNDSDIVLGSERTKADRANIAKKYGEFVKVQYPEAVGHEWDWGIDGSEFMNRWRSFFFHRIASSKGRKGGMMTYTSMARLRWDCLFLMIEFTDSFHNEKSSKMTRATFIWIQQAQRNFKLDTELRERSYFGPDEVKLLLAGAMMDAQCYNNSIQHAIAIILELETGIRPSSAFAVRSYRDCYLKFKNIKIFREANAPGRFTTELTIEWWKGYHETSRLRIVYSLRATAAIEHLDLDVGCYLIAHGIRRGLFKNHATLESLLAGDEHWILYNDEILDDPFFVQATKRGLGIDPTKPMRDTNHREFMQRIGISVGLGGSESGVTSYAMRRNFATVISNRAGKDKARKAMAHKANSTTLETTYDDDIRRTDFVGLILGGPVTSAEDMRKGHQAAVMRLETVAAPALDPKALEERLPMLKILSQQAIDLKDCITEGIVEWKPFVYDASILSPDDTAATTYAWTIRRMKRLVRREQQAYQSEWRLEQLADVRAEITVTEIERRRKELDNLRVSKLVAQVANSDCYDDGEDEQDDEIVELIVDTERYDTLARDGEDLDPKYQANTRDRINFIKNMINMRESRFADLFCEDCASDFTCSSDDVEKNWSSVSHLEHHQSGDFHNLKTRVARLLKNPEHYCYNETTHRYICAWCTKTAGTNRISCASARIIVDHLCSQHEDDMSAEAFELLAQFRGSNTAVANMPRTTAAHDLKNSLVWGSNPLILQSIEGRVGPVVEMGSVPAEWVDEMLQVGEIGLEDTPDAWMDDMWQVGESGLVDTPDGWMEEMFLQ